MSSPQPYISPTGLYLDQLVSTGKPSLARLDIVDRCVRHFVGEVLELHSGFLQSSGSPADSARALAGLEGIARQLGDVFLGRDARFDAQPFNTPARLGSVLKVLVPEETVHYGDPGAALFMWLANQTLLAARLQGTGKLSEAQARERLDGVVRDVVARLLGVK